MKVSYDRLWKLLIDKKMKKVHLIEAIGSTRNVLAKMNKDQPVSMTLLLKMCEYLGCDFSDMIEAVPDELNKESTP